MAAVIPLAGWAQAQLEDIAALCPSRRPAMPLAQDLMRERAHANGIAVPGKVSAGGGCRFYRARDGWIALNLARPDDRTLLPALFACDQNDCALPAQIDRRFAGMTEAQAVARGRLLGLAIGGLSEVAASPARQISMRGPRSAQPAARPRVLDLTALWAGPLAGRLLGLAGADILKIESTDRPDPMRHSDAVHFAALNQNKRHARLAFRSAEGRARLLALIEGADIVLEAARPRALRQLGIDADALVRSRPGLSWVTITGHGICGDAADWIAFGDDAGVAGGLSRALFDASGKVGFVGDAIGDPLTGIAAARAALAAHRDGGGQRIVLSMSGVVRAALEDEHVRHGPLLARQLAAWAAAQGTPFRARHAPASAEPVAC